MSGPRAFRPSLLRRPKAFLSAIFVGLVAPSLLFVTANAAETAPSAKIVAPSCGSQVRVEFGGGDDTSFEIYRGDGTQKVADAYTFGRMASVQFALSGPENITVKRAGVVLASTKAAVAAACSPARYATPSLKVWSISSVIDAPSCGSDATALLNNGMSGERWFEVWSGGGDPDVLFSLSGNTAITANVVAGSSAKAAAVVWNGTTLASKSVTSASPCRWTTTTTTAKPTTTTAKPTTTTVKPPTTCASGDNRSGFGCPILVDNFTGTSLNTSAGSAGWSIYNFPDAAHPRIAKNFVVANGEAQLKGTYDKKTGLIYGAGAVQHIEQKYGRYEVRMKADKGRGWSDVSLLWPVNDANWPRDGELDLFEIPSADKQLVYQIAHNGVPMQATSKTKKMDATQWHTYALEWTPTKLTYYIDNAVVLSTTDKRYVPTTGNLRLTLQLDPGDKGNCGGWYLCADSTTPAQSIMHVDYVKIWQRKS